MPVFPTRISLRPPKYHDHWQSVSLSSKSRPVFITVAAFSTTDHTISEISTFLRSTLPTQIEVIVRVVDLVDAKAVSSIAIATIQISVSMRLQHTTGMLQKQHRSHHRWSKREPATLTSNPKKICST